MNGNRLMKQVMAIFSIFMVFFYLSVGIYFVFFLKQSYLDRAIQVIMGTAFIFYGIYRAFRAYTNITEAFFTKDEDDE